MNKFNETEIEGEWKGWNSLLIQRLNCDANQVNSKTYQNHFKFKWIFWIQIGEKTRIICFLFAVWANKCNIYANRHIETG